MAKKTKTSYVISAAGEKGEIFGTETTCRTEGCPGKRISVRWPDGKVTRPCTRGLFPTKGGNWKVRPEPSSERFSLVHVYGAVDPSVLGTEKTYEKVLAEARKFIKSDDYNEGEDNVFYIVTQDGKPPRICSFTNSELDNEPDSEVIGGN